MSELNYEKKAAGGKNKDLDSTFSNLQNSFTNSNFSEKENKINIKAYENIVMKIDNVTITEEKTLKQLKENLIYLECKVPLFKVDKKTNNNPEQEKNKKNKNEQDQNEQQEKEKEKENIFYDTFK